MDKPILNTRPVSSLLSCLCLCDLLPSELSDVQMNQLEKIKQATALINSAPNNVNFDPVGALRSSLPALSEGFTAR